MWYAGADLCMREASARGSASAISLIKNRFCSATAISSILWPTLQQNGALQGERDSLNVGGREFTVHQGLCLGLRIGDLIEQPSRNSATVSIHLSSQGGACSRATRLCWG